MVADEVRALAERSGRETKQIAELIQQVQSRTEDSTRAMASGSTKVEQGAAKARQAGQALEAIRSAVDATERQVTSVATSSRDGRWCTHRNHCHTVDHTVVEENTSATEQMAAQAEQMMGSMQSIAVDEEQSAATEQVSASAEEMSAQIEDLSAQARELAGTADKLTALARRFRLTRDDPSSLVEEDLALLPRAA